MPDFTMCDHQFCPNSFDCVRHPESGTEPDKHRQSWFLDPPTITEVEVDLGDWSEIRYDCKYFWGRA